MEINPLGIERGFSMIKLHSLEFEISRIIQTGVINPHSELQISGQYGFTEESSEVIFIFKYVKYLIQWKIRYEQN